MFFTSMVPANSSVVTHTLLIVPW